ECKRGQSRAASEGHAWMPPGATDREGSQSACGSQRSRAITPFEGAAMLRYAAITGWGHCVPERVLTNRELEARIETTDEWIWTRTGIRERRIASANETTSSLC